MHPILSKSPVTYVLAQVRFSNIENIVDYISKLQDDIRGLFPHFLKLNIQEVQLRDNQQPITLLRNQWHFIDKDNHMGILLDSSSITIHTSKYDQFELLHENFIKVIAQFNKILKINLFTRIGLRYINLLQEHVDTIKTGLLGFRIGEPDLERDKFLTKTECTQVSKHGLLKVQATYIGNKEIISTAKNLFVPPDLAEIASMLSFKHHKEPLNNFLILDIDHFSEQQGDFEEVKISNRLQELQDLIYRTFCGAVGKDFLKNLM